MFLGHLQTVRRKRKEHWYRRTRGFDQCRNFVSTQWANSVYVILALGSKTRNPQPQTLNRTPYTLNPSPTHGTQISFASPCVAGWRRGLIVTGNS